MRTAKSRSNSTRRVLSRDQLLDRRLATGQVGPSPYQSRKEVCLRRCTVALLKGDSDSSGDREGRVCVRMCLAFCNRGAPRICGALTPLDGKYQVKSTNKLASL